MTQFLCWSWRPITAANGACGLSVGFRSRALVDIPVLKRYLLKCRVLKVAVALKLKGWGCFWLRWPSVRPRDCPVLLHLIASAAQLSWLQVFEMSNAFYIMAEWIKKMRWPASSRAVTLCWRTYLTRLLCMPSTLTPSSVFRPLSQTSSLTFWSTSVLGCPSSR